MDDTSRAQPNGTPERPLTDAGDPRGRPDQGDDRQRPAGKRRTTTSSFGTGRRESHDATPFYSRNLHRGPAAPGRILLQALMAASSGVTPGGGPDGSAQACPAASEHPLDGSPWVDRIYCHSAEDMSVIPDGEVGLAFTSPPYNVGKEYDDDLHLAAYLDLIQAVGQEVYRVLRPGGRYVINIANLGRKPYIPLHMFFYELHMRIGFLPMGEIIWRKARGASGSCAWGSWMSAKAPRLRDVHEYLLVFAKGDYSRPDKGISDISRDEFLESTLSVWEILPESAKRVGHPAPFPVELAERVIRLYSYVGDVVLDPFMGSGTTCVAALRTGRHYVGFDVEPDYCALAEARLAEACRQGDPGASSTTDPRQ